MTKAQKQFQKKLVGFGMLTVFIVFIAFGLGAVKAFAQTESETTLQQEAPANTGTPQKHTDKDIVKFAFLSAAIAVGVGAIGGGLAVGYVGAAAMGAIGEKPELAIRALLFVGLAEGIAIYGLIIAIMILGKV